MNEEKLERRHSGDAVISPGARPYGEGTLDLKLNQNINHRLLKAVEHFFSPFFCIHDFQIYSSLKSPLMFLQVQTPKTRQRSEAIPRPHAASSVLPLVWL